MAQATRSLVKGPDGRYRVSIVDSATGLPVEDLTAYGGNIVGGNAPVPAQTGSTMPSAIQTDTGTVEEQVANPLAYEKQLIKRQMGGGEGLNRAPTTPVADNAYNADGTPNRFGAKIAGMATGMVGGTLGAVAGGLVAGPIGAAVGGLAGRAIATNDRLGDKISPNGKLYGWGIGQPKAEAVIAEIDKEKGGAPVRQDQVTSIGASAPVGGVERTSLNPVGAGSSSSSIPSYDELSAAVGDSQDITPSANRFGWSAQTVSVPSTDARPTIDGQPVVQGNYNISFSPDQTKNVQAGMQGLVRDRDRTGLNAGIRGVMDAVESAVPGIGINSGYRDPAHNARVGGARNSQHTHGNAIDISTKSLTEEQKVATLEAAAQAGARGFGIYNGGTTIHADTRPNFATWGPSPAGQYVGVSINDQPGWAQNTLRSAMGAGSSQLLSRFGPTPTPRDQAIASAPTSAATSTAIGDRIDGYMDHAAQAESGGNPNARSNVPGASAAGLFGFTSGTWRDLGGRHPELGLSEENRMDPDKQRQAMRAFTEDNASSLRSMGLEDSNPNLYTAHHLGISGARAVLTASEDTKLSDVLSPQAMSQNKHLRSMTVKDFKAFAERKAPNPTAVDETREALGERESKLTNQPTKTTAERATESEDKRTHDPDKAATEMARAVNQENKAQAAAQASPSTTSRGAGLGMAAFNSLSFSGGLIGATADERSSRAKSQERDKEAESDKDNDTSSTSGNKSQGSSGSKSGSGGSDKGNQNTSKSGDTGKGLGSSSKSRDDDKGSNKSNDSKGSGSSKGGNKR